MKNILIMALLASLSGSVLADTTGSTKATASLSSSCRFNSTDAIFGSYDPNSATHQQTSQTVDIYCTRGTAWTFYSGATDMYVAYGSVNINGYAVAGNLYSAMTSGSNKLLYQVQMQNGTWENDLYHDAGLTNAYTGTGTGAKQSLTLPYRILKGQYVVPGNYSDTATGYIKF